MITGVATVVAALITVRAGRQAPTTTTTVEPVTRPRESLVERGRSLFDRLPALKKRRRVWLAALAGFLLGGIGVALTFRTLPDTLIGALLALPFVAVVAVQPDGAAETSATPWWYWPFAALAALYAVFRAETANRRLEQA